VDPVVGVVGAGTMGSGIAITVARAGFRTIVVDQLDDQLATSRDQIAAFFDRSVAKGKLSTDERDAALERITHDTSLAPLAAADVVIEAVFERLDVKHALLGELDAVCPPATVYVTNTSTLSVTQIAAGTAHPERVVGMHFCNPAPLMPLIEVVRGLDTDDTTHDLAMDLSVRLGKQPISVGDTPGFIVNRFLLPYENDCIRALEAGLGSVEDLDQGLVLGLGYPMGPFTLLDIVGLDTHRAVSMSIYEQLKDPRFAPPPLVDRMIAAGRLGRKAGRGFYTYDTAGMFGT